FHLIAITCVSTELIARKLDRSIAAEKVCDVSKPLAPIEPAADSRTFKTMTFRVVINLKIGGRALRSRQPHVRNDRREFSGAIGISKAGQAKQRIELIADTWSNGSAECRVEEVLLGDAPTEDFAGSEQTISDRVLHFVRVGHQIDIVHDDGVAKAI